jgi:anti-sigma factor ChrR (cupin superfamily)
VAGSVTMAGLFGRTNWDDIEWQPFRPGVHAHWLYRTEDDGPAAALLRYEPGASVPLHEHAGWEHILVLTGAQSDGKVRHGEGSLMISAPETRHAIMSPEGCIVLAIWQRPVRIVDSET